MRKCLLVAQGPLQIIAGLIALEWFGLAKHGSGDAEIVLVLQDFGVTSEIEKQLQETALGLSRARKWSKTIFISGEKMSHILRRRYSKSIKQYRAAIGEAAFDEIYLARDMGGAGNALALNAYVGAKRIVYGDSFGYVGYEEDTYPSWSSSLIATRNHLKVLARKLLFGGPKKIGFDTAVLTVPVDWSGRYLREIPLLIPDKSYAAVVLNAFSSRLTDLHAYCESLLASLKDPWVMLLSNLSQAGFMSEQNEIDFYIEMIRKSVPSGSSILLKPHPRGNSRVLQGVLARIASDHQTRIVDEPRFARIPIELWTTLTSKCRFITVSSVSGVYLHYFYGAEASVFLDESAILRYVHPKWRCYLTKVNTVLAESLSKIDAWDGKSVLWSGAAPRLTRESLQP